MSETNTLPVAANGGDVAFTGAGAGDVASALQTFMASLHRRSEVFDDITVLHSETKADGSTRNVFSYRACKHR